MSRSIAEIEADIAVQEQKILSFRAEQEFLEVKIKRLDAWIAALDQLIAVLSQKASGAE